MAGDGAGMEEVQENRAVSLTAGDVRKGISGVLESVILCTLIYWFMPVVIVNAFSLIVKLAGWPTPSDSVQYLVRFLGMYLITMPLMILVLSRHPETKPERTAFKGKQFIRLLAVSFGIMITCNVIGTVISAIVESFVGVQIQDYGVIELISEVDTSLALVFISIVGPIYEELIFRRMLVTRFLRYGEGVAVVLSALIFGVFHGNWSQFTYTFAIGMFFAVIYVKTGDIRISMALHITINFIGSVLLGSLMKWAQYDQLLKVVMSARSGDMSQAVSFVTDNLTPVLCLYAFIFLEYAMAIAGIYLFMTHIGQVKLNARDYVADKKEKAKVMFLNFGMISFLILWIVEIVLTILGV